MKKEAKLTVFQQVKKDLYEGKIKAPTVSADGNDVPYFRYQLAVHKMELSLMSNGMKLNRHSKLKPLKEYYGLKGKTAKECLPQMLQIIADYEAELIASN